MSSPGAKPQKEPSDFNFEKIEAHAIAVASYIEQIKASEQLWIMNRLQWLLVSQSFLVLAFVSLGSATKSPLFSDATLSFLRRGIPWVALICCVIVEIAIFAAGRESGFLADARGNMCSYINERCNTAIPLIGRKIRDRKWTLWAGAVAHRLLPLVLGAFWILALFKRP
jgi:hypothetical protein